MEHEVVGEITSRTELLMTMYQIVEDLGQNKIDQVQVEKLAKEFETKRNQLNINLKEKFKELRQ